MTFLQLNIEPLSSGKFKALDCSRRRACTRRRRRRAVVEAQRSVSGKREVVHSYFTECWSKLMRLVPFAISYYGLYCIVESIILNL